MPENENNTDENKTKTKSKLPLLGRSAFDWEDDSKNELANTTRNGMIVFEQMEPSG